jgi:DNA-binding Lrp family transcriptional regulator
MDKTDRQIVTFLGKNVRATLKELADEVHISIPSVQRRIANMESNGQILEYRADLNLDLLGATIICLFGETSRKMDNTILADIEGQGSIYYASFCSSNILFIGSILKNITEMDGLLSFTERVCSIADPQILIPGRGSLCVAGPGILDPIDRDLSSFTELDLKIVKSIHREARKPMAEIAADVGVSTKTVRRRLSRMTKENLITFGMRGLSIGSDVLDSGILVKVRSSECRDAVVRMMRNDPPFFLMNSWIISNTPNTLYFEVQTETVGQMNAMVQKLHSMDEVQSISLFVNMEEHFFDIWTHRMIDEMVFKKK